MKKWSLLLSLAILVGGLSACQKSNQPTSSTPVPPPSSATEEAQAEEEEVIVYRGVVQGVREDTYDGTTYTIVDLEQQDGRNYGPTKVGFLVYDDTVMNVDISELQAGQYVEVYLAFWTVTEKEMLGESLIMNYLGDVAARTTNGTVTEISFTDNAKTKGQITVETLDAKEEIVFPFDETTTFLMEANQIQKGTKLNIFHDAAMATSMPPQIHAVEVAEYEEI